MKLAYGEAVPWFAGETPSMPRFAFSAAGGRYVLLAFVPADPAARAHAAARVAQHRGLFNDRHATAFLVVADEAGYAAAQDQIPGVRWFLDREGAINALYGVEPDHAGWWLLIDPTLRVLNVASFAADEALFAQLAALPAPGEHAGVPLSAPVLIVPRVFEPQVCRRLIEHYDSVGGSVSGVMREIGGKTVGVVDDFKKRRDADVLDETFRAELRTKIARRLLPEIAKVFQFKVTRMERYIVACYDAQEGGYFRAHRDDTTKGTAHRKFAVSINLNAEEFEGGDLKFPEFGPRTYRPPTGGAVVFSCSLLHEATPVTKGRRYAFLPFLYDEAAAQVREANRVFVDHTPAVIDQPDPAPASA